MLLTMKLIFVVMKETLTHPKMGHYITARYCVNLNMMSHNMQFYWRYAKLSIVLLSIRFWSQIFVLIDIFLDQIIDTMSMIISRCGEGVL